jgi:hypothetical protein
MGRSIHGPSGSAKSTADIAGTPIGTIMPKAYVETVGRLEYVWGWPLVNGPSKDVDFSLYIRAYCPKVAILEEASIPPAIQKTN